MAKDRWPELCQSVAKDDGLPVREAGKWTEDKLYFWHRYIEITTTSMVGKQAWREGLCYVDLFSGPGICRLKSTGKRFPGSPLIAANAAKPFSRILLVEKDPSFARACATRLETSAQAAATRVFCGDCNDLVDQVAQELPPEALTLAFIDPEGLDVRFDTLRRLTAGRRVDILVLFAVAYDVLRNIQYYYPDPDSKLDQFLGPDSNWRAKWDQLGNQEGHRARAFFTGLYQDQLSRHLGYVQVADQVMKSPKGPLYTLVYASKHPRGLDFWHKVTQKDSSGQLNLDF